MIDMTLVVFITRKTIEISERNKVNFSFFIKGTIVEIKKKGRNVALCRITVIDSNKANFNGNTPFGGKVELKNDYAKIELTHSNCLRLGDTIIIGPHDNYIIISDTDTILKLNYYDYCNELGRP